jgi:hypothetical protein
MPCSSSDGQGSAESNAQDALREVGKLRRKNDELTSMLCCLLRQISDHVELNPDVARWFEEHKKWDRSQGRT